MSALKSVQLAIVVATQKRDQAGKGVVYAKRALMFAQDQMAQLETYAAETELKWSAAARATTTPELLRHHCQFMDRLHQAIGLQKGALVDAGRRVEVEKKHLLEAEFRLANLGQVLKKKQDAVDLLETRRDQKQMDEFAALRRNQSTGSCFSGDLS